LNSTIEALSFIPILFPLLKGNDYFDFAENYSNK